MADGSNSFGNLVIAAQVNLDTVLREQIGYIPAVWQNMEAAQAAVGQTIQYPLVPTLTLEDATANCCEVPCPELTTWSSSSMTLDYSKAVAFCWTGEEERAINNSQRSGANGFEGTQLNEAIRILINDVERTIAEQAPNAAYSYTPVNGGVLFNQQSDNLKDLTNLRKLLHRAKAPDNDRHLVMGYDAAANLGNVYNVTRANEQNSDETLRNGRFLRMFNFDMHESFMADDEIESGATGTGYLVNNASGYAAGDDAIVVDTGSGTIPAGTKVSFAGNSDIYTVSSFASNTITLSQPLTGAIADNAAVTVDATGYKPQLAFHRRAIVLATRVPSIAGGRDLATNREYITDPVSGLTLMLSEYPGYRAMRYEVSLVWGVKMVKPELAVLIAE
jgi:hypothetical protein